MPPSAGGRAQALDPVVDEDGKVFRQQHDGREREQQHERMVAERSLGRSVVRGEGGSFSIAIAVAITVDRLGEESAVPHGLNGEENAIEQNGDDREQPRPGTARDWDRAPSWRNRG